MNTISKNSLKKIFSIKSEKEKLDFERDLIHFAFIKHIQNQMGDEMKKNQLAKKIGVSASFITQLFTGDKILNIPLLVKFQRALDFKFQIDSSPNDYIKQCHNVEFMGIVKVNDPKPKTLEVNREFVDFKNQNIAV